MKFLPLVLEGKWGSFCDFFLFFFFFPPPWRLNNIYLKIEVKNHYNINKFYEKTNDI